MPDLQLAVAGTPTYAQALNQLIQILTGQADAPGLALFPGIPNPAAPTLAAGAAGNPNGAYKCVVVHVTGLTVGGGGLSLGGFAPSAEATITVTSTAIVWTLPTPPAGTVGRLLYRTVAAGASGSEQFAAWINDATTLSWTDNLADASLGTGMPTASSSPPVYGAAVPASVPTYNSTGTTLAGASGLGPNGVGYWLD